MFLLAHNISRWKVLIAASPRRTEDISPDGPGRSRTSARRFEDQRLSAYSSGLAGARAGPRASEAGPTPNGPVAVAIRLRPLGLGQARQRRADLLGIRTEPALRLENDFARV
jgi:hypothetical protein